MASPIFLDTNVPIYAAGRPHPLKQPCADILTLVAQHPEAFFTDAEVFQELLHRYLALNLWAAAHAVFEQFAILMRGRVEAVQLSDVEQAASLARRFTGLSARDLLHASVMGRVGATRIVTADRGFLALSHLEGLDPAQLENWRHVAIL